MRLLQRKEAEERSLKIESLALTMNADGSQKLEPWVIGKYKNPQCFKNVNKGHRVEYWFNKMKRMAGVICEERLRWLDRQMREMKDYFLVLRVGDGHLD